MQYQKPSLTRLSVMNSTTKVVTGKESDAQGNENTKVDNPTESTMDSIGEGNSAAS